MFVRGHLAGTVPTGARSRAADRARRVGESVGRCPAMLVPTERSLLGVESAVEPGKPSMIDWPKPWEGFPLGAR